MTISKEQLLTRKEDIKKDFDMLVKQIDEQELKIKSMKNNLNALSGASQQCDLFLKELEDKNEMPRDKEQALNIATSQGDKMSKLTLQELNGLSPRARKAHEDSHGVISEILTENPNEIKEVEIDLFDEVKETKKGKKNEKL